jgi:PAS domain S-box-containing protein
LVFLGNSIVDEFSRLEEINSEAKNAKLTLKDLQSQIEEIRDLDSNSEKTSLHYLELFDYAPTSYITLSEDLKIIKCNHASTYLLGRERNQLINMRFDRLIDEECTEHWLRFCLLTRQTNSIQSCELKLLCANHGIIHVKVKSLQRQIEPNGPYLILMTLKDISAYKETDEALRIAAVAFETQDAILVTDANKLILRVNQAFSRITGYDAQEAIGKPPSFLCSGDYDESFTQSIWMSVLINGFWQGEVQEKRKNGEIYPAFVSLTAVKGQDCCISHYVCSFSDITAQKKAEKILLKSRQELETQVTTTIEELLKVKQQKSEINAALTVILNHRENDKNVSQQALSREVQDTILPFLTKLKKVNSGRIQSSQLLSILENNLLELVDSYGCRDNIPVGMQNLTPLELQVASMVRQGMPTKNIAKVLNISEGTVSIHRNHIRKKLGLSGKSENLQVCLKNIIS